MTEQPPYQAYHWPADNRTSFDTEALAAQHILLRMLKIFDQICTQHNIDYWLDYGTLLGAIRHTGFIPWDVEADVGMLRPDFELFLQVGKQNLPHDIFFQNKDSDPAYASSATYIEAKLRDKYSNYYEFSTNHPECKWHNGIQVDIFVYDMDYTVDGYISNAFERLITNRKSYFKDDEIDYTTMHPFEDTHFPVPVSYDPYLKRNYGDYMVYPPLEKQIPEPVHIIQPCNHPQILYWK